MENNKVHIKAAKMLHDFENMETIHPSEEWNESLMERLNQMKPGTSVSSSLRRFNAVLILFGFINLCFVLNALMVKSPAKQAREKELMEISAEILINPSSINH